MHTHIIHMYKLIHSSTQSNIENIHVDIEPHSCMKTYINTHKQREKYKEYKYTDWQPKFYTQDITNTLYVQKMNRLKDKHTCT